MKPGDAFRFLDELSRRRQSADATSVHDRRLPIRTIGPSSSMNGYVPPQGPWERAGNVSIAEMLGSIVSNMSGYAGGQQAARLLNDGHPMQAGLLTLLTLGGRGRGVRPETAVQAAETKLSGQALEQALERLKLKSASYVPSVKDAVGLDQRLGSGLSGVPQFLDMEPMRQRLWHLYQMPIEQLKQHAAEVQSLANRASIPSQFLDHADVVQMAEHGYGGAGYEVANANEIRSLADMITKRLSHRSVGPPTPRIGLSK